MKMFRKIFLILLFSCSCIGRVYIQAVTQNKTTSNRLSQVSVISIGQDAFGNLWFGTRNGLNRYDGSNLTVFKTDRDNPNSIPGNHIEHMTYSGNFMWFQTKNFLFSFDIYTEQFTNYPINNISSFVVDDDKVWVADKEKIYNLLNQNETVDVTLSTGESVNKLLLDRHILWVGTTKRLFKYYFNSKRLEVVDSLINVQSLFVDSRQNLWVGTNDDGVFRYGAGNKVIHFRGGGELLSESVRCFEEADDGSIWIGTFLGLDIIDVKDEISHYQYNDESNSTISHNSVRSLFKDDRGTIWVGTYFGGVDYFYPNNSFFHYYPENTDDNQGVNYRVVGKMVHGDKNNLWICTEGKGLNYFDREKQRFEYYMLPRNEFGFEAFNLKSIYNYKDSLLWIGAYIGGLYSFDTYLHVFTSYPNLKNGKYSFARNTISSIISHEGKLLIGTHEGLYCFEPKEKEFSPLLFDEEGGHLALRVVSLLVDKDDAMLWIGTEYSGLWSYNLNSGELENYSRATHPSLADNFIYDIFQDNDSNLWVATSNGLNKYLPDSDDFDYYSEQDGLPDNFVLCLSEHGDGKLVVTTSKGVSILHDGVVTRNITRVNGLPLTELNQGGLCIMPDGEVFLGGIDGLASFNLNDYLDKKVNAIPSVTGLLVNNKSVVPGDKFGILNKSIFVTSSIVLKHFHTSFTLRFTDGFFIQSEKQQLEYKLVGFDEDWMNARGYEVSYTNLDAGNYTFIVRNKNREELSTRLNIRVRPPYYSTLLAKLVYVFLVLGVVYLISRFWFRQREQRKEEALNQSKLRFFTNISHEFRTPLTLITGQTELLMENSNLSSPDYKRILNIHKNASRLKNLISELLDFRKQEHGLLKIRVSEYDIISFLEEIFQSFVELSKHTHILYRFDHPLSEVNLWFDWAQMEKVFYNLLSNAFKFTPEHGQVLLGIEEEINGVRIMVADTGSGMSYENLNLIFDRFYQLDNLSNGDNRGTGIGLALSKGIVEAHKGEINVRSNVNTGSVFSVFMRYGKEHFSSEEIVEIKTQVGSITTDEESKPLKPLENNAYKESILVVEDNHEVQDFLKDLLNPLFNVKVADNGLEGFKVAVKEQPNIILSDVLMPQMSGTEMCSKIKTSVETSHIPVVLLTARVSEEFKIEGLDTGADDYITKPFNTRVLVARLNNILNNRKSLHRQLDNMSPNNIRRVAKNKIDRDFMDKARDTINQNLDNTAYCVSDFAVDMNVGRTILFSKIKSITGKTPNNFIISCRLEKSQHMMKVNPDVTVSEVAYTCGFSTPDYFGRLFKKKYGLTPTQFLKKLNG